MRGTAAARLLLLGALASPAAAQTIPDHPDKLTFRPLVYNAKEREAALVSRRSFMEAKHIWRVTDLAGLVLVVAAVVAAQTPELAAKAQRGKQAMASGNFDLAAQIYAELSEALPIVSFARAPESVDVLELESSLVVLVEVPGLAAGDLRVEVVDNTVQIKGRRRLAFAAAGRVRFHCLERQEGGFARQVEITAPVDFRRASVVLADGVLRIELPKVEERRRRTFGLTIEERAEPPASAPEEKPPDER